MTNDTSTQDASEPTPDTRREAVLERMTAEPRIATGHFAKLPFCGYRGRRRQPVRLRFKNLGVTIRTGEADNPNFDHGARESGKNPRRITVERNTNESPLVRLEAIGSLDARQARAGHLFRQLYERLMAGQASPSHLKERVDGGAAPDVFTEARARASSQLRRISQEMTEGDYAILRFVCGEGRSLRELDARLQIRKGGSKPILIGALDRLAEVLGLAKSRRSDA